MKKLTKKIVALTLAVTCAWGTASMAMTPFPEGGNRRTDQYGRWIHSDRDKPTDWYNQWIAHQMELDARGELNYKEPTGKTWLDWWEINH